MKTFLIFLIICFFFNGAFAQKKKQKDEKVFLGVNIGPSFPQSDFANTDYTVNSGYAKTGYRIELYGGVNVVSMFGISVMGFFNLNPTDPDNLKTKLNADYPGNNWQINSKNWEVIGGLGGLSFKYPMSKKASLHLTLLGGYLSAKSPELNFVSDTNVYKIESNTASSWSYLTSIGVYYDLGQNVSGTLDFEYLGSRPKFDNVKTSANINGNLTESTTSFIREIAAFNIAIGFKYSFR
jgi:hypothetical protein